MNREQTIGDIVEHHPALSRVFDRLGIDYCCSGKMTIEQACEERGLDPGLVLDRLENFSPPKGETTPPADVAAMSLTALANHIEESHHVYLRSELPRISELISAILAEHADEAPYLHHVQEVFRAMALELWAHMIKEEMCLFPMIRDLESHKAPPEFHVRTIASPIRRMELEHRSADAALRKLRELTDNYTPPDWACNSYRDLLESLYRLEQDTHLHVQMEDEVLFPRALDLEHETRLASATSDVSNEST